MPRIAAVLVLVAATLGLVAPSANAQPDAKLAATLGSLWTKVLETPGPQNPFVVGNDKATPCWDLGGTVAPLGALGHPVKSCTVKPGTKIFVSASSAECSTFPNDCQASAPTEAQLPGLASTLVDQKPPSVTLDGHAVAVTRVQTGLLNVVLPGDNVFGNPGLGGVAGKSVALGWVALLHPLTPGAHTITINSSQGLITTQIVVQPGHK